MNSLRILLVDDDLQSLDSTRRILEIEGHEVVTAADGADALEKLRLAATPFDLCLSDVRMPRLGGMEFLKAVSVRGDDLPVLLMTAFGTVEDAVHAMKLGAVDFLSKPFKRQTLLAAMAGVVERVRARKNSETLVAEKSDGLLGESPALQRLKLELEQVAHVSATVLVRGESGTGKERVARLIHEKSPRARGPWIALNCAALPENLIESELFGHEKGAFTGAQQSHEGLFEAASGGTLFLDEIGDMPLALQSRLLRTLQEGEVRRLGSTVSRKVDVRVIAATHRDLHECVRAGSFRQDLLFRLEVLTLDVPPLRAREGDIERLAMHFLADFSKRHGKPISGLDSVFLNALRAHPWPGNVRELQNVMERAVVFGRENEALGLESLPEHLRGLEGTSVSSVGATPWDDTIAVRIGTPLREVEDLLIKRTLEAAEGDKAITAQLLGINARTIYRKLEKWSAEGEAPQSRSDPIAPLE